MQQIRQKKKNRFFLLSELLIALALWAIASPLIWSLSLHQVKQTMNSFKDYERARIAKNTLFWTLAGESEQVDTLVDSKEPRARALIPTLEETEVFSWENYHYSGLTKRARKNRESFLLAHGAIGVAGDRAQKTEKWNYRVFCNSYRLEQMPASPSKLHPVWKRLICLEMAVVFQGENPPPLVNGSLLGPLLLSQNPPTQEPELLTKKQIQTAQERFQRSYYSYLTLLKRKQETI